MSAAGVYRGRFAPAPTGPLHIGSVIAAVGSFLEARSRAGQWLVRMDDLDGPRNAPGAADAILHELERLELHWDGEVALQSTREARYAAALERLASAGWSFPCGCTRREVAGRAYPGTCRAGLPATKRPRSVRVKVAAGDIEVHDAVQGRSRQNLAAAVGDFVVLRADAIVAYHLAVVVDDAEQGVTDVVRGADLLESTARQVHLQRLLGWPSPAYAHLPVAVNRAGQKLSKQTHARATSSMDRSGLLGVVLEFLGHSLPADLRGAPPGDLWRWAIGTWRLDRVPRVRSVVFDDGQLGLAD